MKLSESGSRHYTDDEIENITKNLFEVGSSSYTNGEVVHTSYGRVIEQLKIERDEANALHVEACDHVRILHGEYGQLKLKYLAETRQLEGHIRRMRDCVLFFSSVIKSGEKWSEECEASIRRALAKERDGE